MENIKVSIIVPVYNVKQFLSQCLDSLINQTLKDIQIILVNDGSIDGSDVICDEYKAKDSRIICKHKNNEGVTKARALGVKEAIGEFVMFVDGDDTLPVGALEYLYNKLKVNHCDIIQGCWKNIYPTRERRGYLLRNGKMSGSEYIQQLLGGGAPVGILGKMIRKSLFDDTVMNIPPSIKNNEDLLMNVMLAQKTTNVYFAAKFDVYHYYIRGNSASTRKLDLVSWEQMFEILGDLTFLKYKRLYLEYILYLMVRLKKTDPDIDFSNSYYFKLCKSHLNHRLLNRIKASINYIQTPSPINCRIVNTYIFLAKIRRPFICLLHNSL